MSTATITTTGLAPAESFLQGDMVTVAGQEHYAPVMLGVLLEENLSYWDSHFIESNNIARIERFGIFNAASQAHLCAFDANYWVWFTGDYHAYDAQGNYIDTDAVRDRLEKEAQEGVEAHYLSTKDAAFQKCFLLQRVDQAMMDDVDHNSGKSADRDDFEDICDAIISNLIAGEQENSSIYNEYHRAKRAGKEQG